MGARAGSLSLVLASGQVQRVLVEAGSMLVVSSGAFRIRYPYAVLAEQLVAVEVSLDAEAVCCLQEGGWIELVASAPAAALILPPESAGLWARLGRYLERSLAKTARATVSSSCPGPTA